MAVSMVDRSVAMTVPTTADSKAELRAVSKALPMAESSAALKAVLTAAWKEMQTAEMWDACWVAWRVSRTAGPTVGHWAVAMVDAMAGWTDLPRAALTAASKAVSKVAVKAGSRAAM
jgi:hypothetical protein